MPGLRGQLDQAFSLVGRLARLGWTRIVSPGAFGQRIPEELFGVAIAQVVRDRRWVGSSGEFPRLDRRTELELPRAATIAVHGGGALHGCLRHHSGYDETTAWHSERDEPTPLPDGMRPWDV